MDSLPHFLALYEYWYDINGIKYIYPIPNLISFIVVLFKVCLIICAFFVHMYLHLVTNVCKVLQEPTLNCVSNRFKENRFGLGKKHITLTV